MAAKLIVALVVEAFDVLATIDPLDLSLNDSTFLDCSVHALNLAVPRGKGPPDLFLILGTPRVVWLGQAVLYPVGLADHVKAHLPRIELRLRQYSCFDQSASRRMKRSRYRCIDKFPKKQGMKRSFSRYNKEALGMR